MQRLWISQEEREKHEIEKTVELKGAFHGKESVVREKRGTDLTEAEQIKKDRQEGVHVKNFNIDDSYRDPASKPDILGSKVQWPLTNIANNKASGCKSILYPKPWKMMVQR